MTVLRNSLLALLLVCPGAWGAPGGSLLQGMLRDSRAAYFRGEYEESMRLAMEVLLEDPSDDDAREILRKSAKVLADKNVEEVQLERERLLQGAREAHAKREERHKQEEAFSLKEKALHGERLAQAENARPEWSAWTRAYLAHSEFLEAYRMIFMVKDQFPKEPWVEIQLERVSAAIERDHAELETRPAWYREAVAGYQAFTSGKMEEAGNLWRSALERPGASAYPNREAIVTRLQETAPKPQRPPVAAAKPRLSRRPASPPRGPAAAPQPAKVEPPPPPPGPTAKEIEALYVQGLVHYGMGHIQDAVRTWEQVLQYDPKHPAAQRALARAKRELGGTP